jgi:CPA1 family monovalent cation:H+ antiporter
LSLAVPGLMAAILLTAVAFTPMVNELPLGLSLRFTDALVFAAVIAATDDRGRRPVPESAGAQTSGRLVGASLINDGVAVVDCSRWSMISLGGEFHASVAIFDFVRVAGMGAIVGLVLGWRLTW